MQSRMSGLLTEARLACGEVAAAARNVFPSGHALPGNSRSVTGAVLLVDEEYFAETMNRLSLPGFGACLTLPAPSSPVVPCVGSWRSDIRRAGPPDIGSTTPNVGG